MAGPSLPPALAGLHPAGLGFEAPVLYANFVESIDGVVALDPDRPSGPDVSGHNEGDRFLMGLLRAFADVVLVGAGTLRADSGHLWTPGYIYPPAKAAYAELRSSRGLRPEPRLAVVTASGHIDPNEPALQGGLVLTGRDGAARLRSALPRGVDLLELAAPDELDAAEIVKALRQLGLSTVLTEGGPSLLGRLLEHGLLDELFVTLSPVLAGHVPGERRLGLAEGVRLLPDAGRWGRLLSVQRAGSHLFLRYDLRR